MKQLYLSMRLPLLATLALVVIAGCLDSEPVPDRTWDSTPVGVPTSAPAEQLREPTTRPSVIAGEIEATTPAAPATTLPIEAIESNSYTPTRQPVVSSTRIAPLPTSTFVASCGDGPVLTHSPMSEGTYSDITPLGNLAPPSHTFPTGHMYFGLPFEETGGTAGPFGNGMVFPSQEIFAAADALITRISVSDIETSQSGTTEKFREYGLRFEVCDGIEIRYGHMGPLSERLESMIGAVKPLWCNSYETGVWKLDSCEYAPEQLVSAGEFVGYTSGRAAAFDFGATIPGYDDPGERIAVCPLDLYGDHQRFMFESRLGDGQTKRTTEPVCGTVYQDLPGTAQGRWYKTLDGHPIEDENIALVHDNIDPSVPVFSIGNSVPNLPSNAYRFIPSNSAGVNTEFASVMPGSGVTCYESLSDRWGEIEDNLVLLIELPDASTLHIEARSQSSCDAGPWQFTEKAAVFVR